MQSFILLKFNQKQSIFEWKFCWKFFTEKVFFFQFADIEYKDSSITQIKQKSQEFNDMKKCHLCLKDYNSHE